VVACTVEEGADRHGGRHRPIFTLLAIVIPSSDSGGKKAASSPQNLDNTAKHCRAALKSYRIVLSNYDATLEVAQKAASNLQFDQMTAAFKLYVPATRRYAKFTLNALAACEPK
jgi:hypothetical protein